MFIVLNFEIDRTNDKIRAGGLSEVFLRICKEGRWHVLQVRLYRGWPSFTFVYFLANEDERESTPAKRPTILCLRKNTPWVKYFELNRSQPFSLSCSQENPSGCLRKFWWGKPRKGIVSVADSDTDQQSALHIQLEMPVTARERWKSSCWKRWFWPSVCATGRSKFQHVFLQLRCASAQLLLFSISSILKASQTFWPRLYLLHSVLTFQLNSTWLYFSNFSVI